MPCSLAGNVSARTRLIQLIAPSQFPVEEEKGLAAKIFPT